MTTIDRRYPLRVDVRDGLDREAVLRAGVETVWRAGAGAAEERGIFLIHRPNNHIDHAFSVNASECRNLLHAVQAVCDALDMRSRS